VYGEWIVMGRFRSSALGLLAAMILFGTTARAQDKTCAPGDPACNSGRSSKSGVLQIGEITIVGRVQKPIAAVDVAKIQAKLTLAELRQPFLDRIEEAVRKDPF
jgi:hypothetical protein